MVASVPPAVPNPPPGTPADETVRSMLSLGRSLALIFAIVAGLLFLVLLVLGVIEAILGAVPTDIFGAVYALVSAMVNYLIWRELPRLEGLAAQRQYAYLRDQLLLWAILGLLFFVVVGVVLLVAWIRVEGLMTPATVSPMVPPPPPAGSTVCPRCGSPASWIADSQRYYCYRCSAYL